MARSLSNAKLISSFVVDRISASVVRRGYAAASQGVLSGSVSGAGSGGVMGKKVGEGSTKTSSWVPDPVTGYYRPENHADEIDVAELREMLLNNKVRRH
ncbi:hypothetical protein RHSIM_Rhsim13G0009300 [Rhododendron simsii]|uniref:Uncharacterized protein n=1 Tax=Rhododendron simsii TaxID=118357 RepID=A0A834G0H6_RHOSS|nr:hypothetical protein RHSIM_Rhsim13G0009300 [Rhododendron simsii]